MHKSPSENLGLENVDENHIAQLSVVKEGSGPNSMDGLVAAKSRKTEKSILLVDDDDLVAQTIKLMLVTEGYRVEVVDNGIDAIKSFETQKFDLIISDLFMPVMNGWEVIQHIRQRSSTVPIFIFTGGMEELIREQRDRMKELCVNEILLKPIRMKQLIDKIAPYLADDAEIKTK